MSAFRSIASMGAMCVLLSWTASAEGPAGPLETPTAQVILSVSGKIAATNIDGQARFDRAMLEGVGMTELTTQTPWTDGHPVFRGVLARDLLAVVGAEGQAITAVALNDYEYTIPAAELEKYPLKLAMEMNGEVMTPRDHGPIWIVYPRDDYPELDTQETDHRMVWQVRELIIE
ncbi:MAG: oxidoreductase [Gammaproteobacteria bacterium]|nr:oxidoreductase [Gammaproteobacteria bacterium]